MLLTGDSKATPPLTPLSQPFSNTIKTASYKKGTIRGAGDLLVSQAGKKHS